MLYVSAPQYSHTMETHAQNATSISISKFDLSFETAISTIQHDQRTDGTDKGSADVQLEPTIVIEDRTSIIATDLLETASSRA